MSQQRRQYDENFKKNDVKLSYATSKTIEEHCEDLGLNPCVLLLAQEVHPGWPAGARFG